MVVINNTTASTDPNPLNGAFRIGAAFPWSPTQFVYTVQSDPGTVTAGGFIGTPFQACSADCGTAAVVEGNRFLNVLTGGPYHDTWSSKDVTVRNNYYRGVHTGPARSLGNTDGSGTPPILPIRTCTLKNGGADGMVATLTTGSPHGLSIGDVILVQNAKVHGVISPYYNGFFAITPVQGDLTKLTYQMGGNPMDVSDLTPHPTFVRLFQEGRVVIENNVIELGLSIFDGLYDPPAAIWFYNTLAPGATLAAPPPYLYDEVVVRRNVIHSLDSAFDFSGNPYALRLDMCAKGIVEESIIDLNSVSWRQIWQVRSNSIVYANNQTPTGDLIPGQLELSENPTAVFAEIEELATLIELACVQSF
jgi:hypothetical protein